VVSLDRHQLPIKLTIAIDNGKDSVQALSTLKEGLTGLVGHCLRCRGDADHHVSAADGGEADDRSRADHPGDHTIRPESGAVAKFSETLVEYAQRLDKDFKDKKLTYSPVLIVVSTSTPSSKRCSRTRSTRR
jgi:hypothetical protein